jgi:hypothetical protein
MQAIIRLPETVIDEGQYITRKIGSASARAITTLIEDLCDEFAFDDPDEFEVIAIVSNSAEILLRDIDFE